MILWVRSEHEIGLVYLVLFEVCSEVEHLDLRCVNPVDVVIVDRVFGDGQSDDICVLSEYAELILRHGHEIHVSSLIILVGVEAPIYHGVVDIGIVDELCVG